jgi:hypothetical protein
MPSSIRDWAELYERLPPDLKPLRHGRWLVLDGVHRLLKAVLVGAETVRAHKLSPEQLAQIAL